MTQYPIDFNSKMRTALMKMAEVIRPTHLITLNFHAKFMPVTAEKRVSQWHSGVCRRLFRTLQPDVSKQLEFVGYPEYTLSGDIHYHLLARIPENYTAKFIQYGAARWKRLVPSSTFHIREIEQTKADLEAVFRYVTKSKSAERVIHSSMLS